MNSKKFPSINQNKKIFTFVFRKSCQVPRIPARLKRDGRVVADDEAGAVDADGVVRRAASMRTAKSCDASAADLKFLQGLPQVRYKNFKSKALQP
jgi:hypothetical protein